MGIFSIFRKRGGQQEPAPEPIPARKPTEQQIRDAGQQAHNEIANWVELWAAGRKSEIPDKYRPRFSHYLLAVTQNESEKADTHYTALRKARTIEILEGGGLTHRGDGWP